MIGSNAITDAMLSKYKSVQEISPEDLARLKSLNTPRARTALSIKDAGGHMLSFDHVVQTYFMIHGPSTRHDIAQWINNNWETRFGSWERLVDPYSIDHSARTWSVQNNSRRHDREMGPARLLDDVVAKVPG